MAVPLDPPEDLAVPRARSQTARTIFSRAMGRLLSEMPGLLRSHAVGELRADVLAVERAVSTLRRKDVGPLASVLRRPHLSTLARVLRGIAPGEAGALTTELCALLAFDLAWLGALPHEITLRHLPPRLVSLPAQVELTLPPGVRGARFANGSINVSIGDGGEVDADRSASRLDLPAIARGDDHPWVRRPYRALDGQSVLALVDNNPLAHIEAHPDKQWGNRVDLGGRSQDEWVSGLREALSLVGTALPGMGADIDLLLSQIIPVGYDAERHLSCSYQEAVGTIYVTLHPSPMTMAEALIHEVSHNKLNALFEVDPVLENSRDELYDSPLRPDPRPLHGVLLAVHAFLPVARMYERLLEIGHPFASSPAFRERFEAIVRGNREGTRVLRDSARPTPLGKGLFAEIMSWDEHFSAAAPRNA
jgi:HEXXH motif-containing protein